MNVSQKISLPGTARFRWLPLLATAFLAACQANRSITQHQTDSPMRHGPVLIDREDGHATFVLQDSEAETPAVAGLAKSRSVIESKMDDKSKKGRKAQHPQGLARERRRKRLDDKGLIPPNALMTAKWQADAMQELQVDRDAGIWNWEWLGPGNIGGRIRSIIIHPTNPSTMWIGGVSGGIWKTTNGGTLLWTPINDFLPSLAITTMVMDPANANVLYAGTGEGFGNSDALPGAGVFKSTDGGDTWTQLAATIPADPDPEEDDWGYVNRLAISPTDSQVILAATNSGIWRSQDGGNWWSQVSSFPFARDVKFHPTDGLEALAGFTGGMARYSNDGGLTWLPALSVSGGDRVEVAYAPSNPNTVYACVDHNGGEVYRSTNGGQSYALRNTGTQYMGTQGWYNNAIWVAPDDQNVIVVGGIDLWRSTDGGANLTRISDWRRYHGPGDSAHCDHHIIIEHPDYGPSNRRVYVGNDGGIQTTDDILTAGDRDWDNLAHHLGITQFYGGAADDDGSVILGGTQDNDTLRLYADDGAQGWFQAKTGDGGFCAISHSDSGTRYCEYVHLHIFKNFLGGDTWFDAVNGLTDADNANRALFIAPFVMDPGDSNRLIAGGASIWRTNNAADEWESIRGVLSGTPLCSAIDIADTSSPRIWVGYDNGRVSRTYQSETNWTNVDDNGPLPDRFVTDIAINPSNPSEVFVTFGGYATDTVWFTPDNGGTWQLRTGSGATALPSVQVNTIRFNPANTNWVYIGTDLGVFASENKGLAWNKTPRFGDHDGPANVEVSELFWQGDHLIAATHGRGMYRTRPLAFIYVDGDYVGPEDGSEAHPYNTVQEAIQAAGQGTMMRVKAGTYNESGTTRFYKRGVVRATNGTVIIR